MGSLRQLGARRAQQLERLDAEDAERDHEHERILGAHGLERALAAFGDQHAQPRLDERATAQLGLVGIGGDDDRRRLHGR